MQAAKFLSGSVTGHVINMTTASAVGLIMLFTSDLVDMFFLSQLGHQPLAAAVGFAGTLLFFATAVCIGLQVGMGALVARSLGASQRQQAGQLCTDVLLFSLFFSLLITAGFAFYIDEMLVFIGASGDTLEYALSYSRILLLSTPFLAVGMGGSAALRSLGDARRSMYVTVIGALVNVGLDPLFIFTFGWGIEGAAWASFCSRMVLFVLAMYWLIKTHRLPQSPRWASFKTSVRPVALIAGPAMLTSLATPLASTYVIKVMANYGDQAVAASAIIGRLVPVTFAVIFALSGAIGPIIGQNAGAGQYDRVRQTVISAMLLNVVYCLVAWLLLFMMRDVIVAVFDAEGETASLIIFYCQYLVGAFLFSGMLFVANAGFNNLNRAYLATTFNFSKALLGVIPFVAIMSTYFGAPGVLAGEAAAAAVFAIIASAVLLRRIEHLRLQLLPTEHSKRA
jgi:putative MATE family efflux protein